jgi:hypothetical protein
MSPISGLQVQEARVLISLRNGRLNQQGHGSKEANQTTPTTLVAPRRAPPTCSECNIRDILELDVFIITRFSLLYLIKNCVVGNSFKFMGVNIFWLVFGSTGSSS